jgi:hypothetical protein
MVNGLQVFNSGGYVQIDETYRNYLKVASGSGSSSSYEISFPSQTSAEPLIFFRPASDSVRVYPVWATSSSFTVSSDGVFEYIVFGLDNPVTDTGTHGLQVFNASSGRIFDSRNEGVRIQHVIRQPMKTAPYSQGPNNFPITVTYPSWGGRPWLCFNSMMYGYGEVSSTGISARTSGTDAIIIESVGPTGTLNDTMVGYYASEMVIPLGRTYW